MPSSLRPRGEEAGVIEYLSPVKINEVTFGKVVLDNGPNGTVREEERGLVIPEQFILIFFMALLELLLFKGDPPLGIVTVLEGFNKSWVILVIAGALTVKLVKLIVFATKPDMPVPVIDDILNDGIDSKE